MAQEQITPKQQEILDYIKEHILEKGYPPSVREIGIKVNLKSTSSVHMHLVSLERKGYIHRDPEKPRAIEIISDGFSAQRREMVSIPIIGKVSANEPTLAEDNIEGYFPLPAEMLPQQQLFMLHIHGDGMINAGILDGDDLICVETSKAENGEIVVVLINDSATVVRFYRERTRIRLQLENDFMDPIFVPYVRVLGKVVSLIRMTV